MLDRTSKIYLSHSTSIVRCYNYINMKPANNIVDKPKTPHLDPFRTEVEP